MAKPRKKSATSGNVRNRQRKNWGIKNGIIEIPIKLKINCKKLLYIFITLAVYCFLIKTYFMNSAHQSGSSEYAIYLNLVRDILNIIFSNYSK